jgi:hypothetical protein
LEFEAFYADRSKSLGRGSLCKECQRAKARRYYAEHRVQILERAAGARRASLGGGVA